VGHLTARLAGQMARVSEVGRLFLTHFFTPYGDYTEEAREDAAKEFKQDVLIAKELNTYDI
jgi:ribonuclease BN (tRNA processing enzyme)